MARYYYNSISLLKHEPKTNASKTVENVIFEISIMLDLALRRYSWRRSG